MLSGCSSVAKRNYIRHLSTTIPPSRRSIETETARITDSDVVVVTPSNRPKP